MTHGSLFSGIGGFDLAAEWMGWENKFHCEFNPFCQKIFKQHFPNSIPYDNIKQTDFTIHRGTIDILTGGFPCQPYSAAGKRKGKEDDRHLWPEMLRAIGEIQPGWVVGENVRGLTNWSGGLVFDEVQADLEAQGYEVLPFLLPACAKNAPHRRDRIWFVAYSNLYGFGRNKERTQGFKLREGGETLSKFDGDGSEGIFTDTGSKGLQRSANIGSVGESRTNRNKQLAGLLPSNWEEFPTVSPVCRTDDGLPNRVDRLKALGNAIVPQVAFEIFKAIQAYETQSYNPVCNL